MGTVEAISRAQSHPAILCGRIFLLRHSLGGRRSSKAPPSQVVLSWPGPGQPEVYRCLVRQLHDIESTLGSPESFYIGKQIDSMQKQADLADSERLTMSSLC